MQWRKSCLLVRAIRQGLDVQFGKSYAFDDDDVYYLHLVRETKGGNVDNNCLQMQMNANTKCDAARLMNMLEGISQACLGLILGSKPLIIPNEFAAVLLQKLLIIQCCLPLQAVRDESTLIARRKRHLPLFIY